MLKPEGMSGGWNSLGRLWSELRSLGCGEVHGGEELNKLSDCETPVRHTPSRSLWYPAAAQNMLNEEASGFWKWAAWAG